MKEIKAIIQRGKLHKIREVLAAVPGFPGMSISLAEGCSPAYTGVERRHSPREELTEFSPKVRIEIIASAEQADELVRLIRDVAHTGLPGDGIVWVTPVEAFFRIKE